MHKPDSPVTPAPHFNPPLPGDPMPLPPTVRENPQTDAKKPIQAPSTRRAQDDLLDTYLSSGDDQAARLARERP